MTITNIRDIVTTLCALYGAGQSFLTARNQRMHRPRAVVTCQDGMMEVEVRIHNVGTTSIRFYKTAGVILPNKVRELIPVPGISNDAVKTLKPDEIYRSKLRRGVLNQAALKHGLSGDTALKAYFEDDAGRAFVSEAFIIQAQDIQKMMQ